MALVSGVSSSPLQSWHGTQNRPSCAGLPQSAPAGTLHLLHFHTLPDVSQKFCGAVGYTTLL